MKVMDSNGYYDIKMLGEICKGGTSQICFLIGSISLQTCIF